MGTTTTRNDDQGSTNLALERTVAQLVTDAQEVRAGTAKAALDAHRAESSDALNGTMADVGEAARTWLDDLSLQARLARMEMRDRAETMSRRLETAGAVSRSIASATSARPSPMR